jgi:transcriptional regulator with XRE-family HTH domain
MHNEATADSLHLAPHEEKVVNALAAVLEAGQIAGVQALRLLRAAGERVPAPVDDRAAAFERVRVRSMGVEDELRTLEGGGLSDAEFARKLGLSSRETIRAYRERGAIFAWEKGTRNLRYPAWQIHEHALLPGLAEVLAILREKGLSPLGLINYFLSESEELDGARPLDLLRQKRIDEVTAHARRYAVLGT